MTLTLNGKTVTLPDAMTLSGLLERQKMTAGQVVVEINQTIPDKARYAETRLSEGDRIEILRFVGGG